MGRWVFRAWVNWWMRGVISRVWRFWVASWRNFLVGKVGCWVFICWARVWAAASLKRSFRFFGFSGMVLLSCVRME